MNPRPLLLLILMLAACCAQAERNLIWRPDSSLRITGRLPYNSVRVIDDRLDKSSSIGFLKTGAFNRYAVLEADDSLHRCLEAYAARLLRGADAVPGELLVVLRDLRIEDRMRGEEIGTVHLSADLFSGSAGVYRHLKNTDTLYETKSGWDVTKAVQQMASAAFIDLLLQGRNTAPDAGADKTFSPDEAVGREEALRQSLPVYRSEAPPRGLYKTIDDFLQLRPSDTDFLEVHIPSIDGPDALMYYHNDGNGERGERIRPADCFAIYNGKQWHVSWHGSFSLLRRQERGDFYAAILRRGLTDNSAMMGAMFGMAGSLIAASDKNLHYTRYRGRIMPDARMFVPVGRAR